MANNDSVAWAEMNQRSLVAGLAEVRAALKLQIAEDSEKPEPIQEPSEVVSEPETGLPALEMICGLFGLSRFERQVLLLCAGMELDASFANLCAAAQRDATRPYPTFSLALAALNEPHWSAVTPAGALRTWRLIEVASHGTYPLMASPLKIDERILHFLTGIQYLDERLAGLMTRVPEARDLVPSHLAAAQQMVAAWSQSQDDLPVIGLHGADEPSRRAVAAAGCAALGLGLQAVSADLLSNGTSELEGVVRLLEREAALTSCALYVDAEGFETSDGRAAIAIGRVLERVNGTVVWSTSEMWRHTRRPLHPIEIQKPSRDEQQSLWENLLQGKANLNGHVARLASQFNLHVPAIRASVCDALTSARQDLPLEQRLWDAGRAQARPRLEAVAGRIEPHAEWDDLVLPDAEKRCLREIIDQVAQRPTVYEAWGFSKNGSRGLGISALFCGPSGTGKTMAAEVLATALRLDLHRIDLAGVVSKYIGETEKNLRRVFDAAEEGGSILFFDEADALFGKRTEVKDSHDRYANIEINYLLQRMESYRGLAILATNRKGDLDPAFLRRIRFVLNFPFPDATQRAEIWRRVFPATAPLEGLDWDKLSRLTVAGGNIRNIAVQAAFLAAAAGEPVRMPHLARAATSEFTKLEKPLMEIGGWK